MVEKNAGTKLNAALELEIIHSNDVDVRAEWDAFVDKSPQGSIFSTTRYLDALDVKYTLLIHRTANRIDAGMVLARGLMGTHSNPLYTKYLGLLYEPINSPKQSKISARQCKLAEPFVQYVSKLRGFEYSFHPAYNNWLPFYWDKFKQQTAYTYCLPQTTAATWLSKAENVTRNELSRGMDAGLIIEEYYGTEKTRLSELYEVNMTPYTSKKQPPLLSNKKFIQFCTKLSKTNSLKHFIVRDNKGNILAAAVVVFDRKYAYFIINGTRISAPRFANRFLICRIIESVHKQGLGFDFEGSMIKPISRFYRDFNPELITYSRIWKPGVAGFLKSTTVKIAKNLLGYNR